MWWKIYFWILAVVTVLGLFGLLEYSPLAPIDIILVVIEIIMLVGLYSYVYKKTVFPSNYWMILFVVIVVDLIFDLLQFYVLPKDYIKENLLFFASKLTTSPADALLTWILILPNIYAVYKLSTPEIKKGKSK